MIKDREEYSKISEDIFKDTNWEEMIEEVENCDHETIWKALLINL